MIEDLKDMVKILLKKFRASTRAIPEKIIFYRDGVSEGQFRDVLINELSAIQRACLELQAGYTPAITFIVVQKRHHARLFAVDPRDRKGKSQNIPAGRFHGLLSYKPFNKSEHLFMLNVYTYNSQKLDICVNLRALIRRVIIKLLCYTTIDANL